MGLYAPSQGNRTKSGKTLSTDTTTLVRVPAGNAAQRATVESIHVACGNSNTALSIWWVDKNGTETFLLSGGVVAANNIFQITDLHLPLEGGESLKADAAAPDLLDVTVVFLQHTPQQAQK